MVGGRRIVDRVIEAARSVASEILFVANDPEAPRWLDQIRIVSDTRPERGSIIGIHTALAATGQPTIVVAWDMPFVTRDLLALIAERGVNEAFAVLPEGEFGIEPFCGLYTPACRPFVERAIDERDLRATALPSRFPSFTRIAASDVATIGDPAHLFFNLNTFDDLNRAEEIEAATKRSR